MRPGAVNFASAVDAITHHHFATPFVGMQMINEANEVFKELEITRIDMCRSAEPSHRTAIKRKGASC